MSNVYNKFDPFWMFKTEHSALMQGLPIYSDHKSTINPHEVLTTLSNIGITFGVNSLLHKGWNALVNWSNKEILKFTILSFLVYLGESKKEDLKSLIDITLFDLILISFIRGYVKAENLSNNRGTVQKNLVKGAWNLLKNRKFSIDNLVESQVRYSDEIRNKVVPQFVNIAITCYITNCYYPFEYITKKEYESIMNKYNKMDLNKIESLNPPANHPKLKENIGDSVSFNKSQIKTYLNNQYFEYECLTGDFNKTYLDKLSFY